MTAGGVVVPAAAETAPTATPEAPAEAADAAHAGAAVPTFPDVSGGPPANAMQAFIHQQLVGILEPFAEHVGELHKVVDQLTSEMTDTTARLVDSETLLEEHGVLLKGLRLDVEGFRQPLADLQDVTERHGGQLFLLEAATETLGERCRSLEVKAETAERSTAVLQGRATELETGVAKWSTAQAQNDIQIADLSSMVKRLQETDQTIDVALREACRQIETARADGEAVRQQNQSFTANHEQQQKRDVETIAYLNRAVDNLAKQLKEQCHRGQTNADHMKTVGVIVRSLKDELAQLTNSVHNVQIEHSGSIKQLQERAAQLLSTTDGIEDRAKTFDGWVKGTLAGHSKLLSKHSDQIETVGKGQKTQSDHMTRVLKGFTVVEEKLAALEDKVKKAESASMQLEEEYQRQMQASKKDDKDEQSKAQLNSFDAMRRKMDLHSTEIQRAQDKIEDHSKDFVTASARMQMMERNVHAIGDAIKKLTSGVDQSREFWTGLSEGLRETRDGLANENRMGLPPKGSHVRTLLELRQTATTVPARPQSSRATTGTHGSR